ncbi:MAG: hypothetical protein R2825_28975 [Saprospiraceae bacterium]
MANRSLVLMPACTCQYRFFFIPLSFLQDEVMTISVGFFVANQSKFAEKRFNIDTVDFLY